MERQFERTALLLGDEAVTKLKKSVVALFGLGGVGGNTFEILVRSGIGKIYVYDADIIDETNINRQLLALHSTVGMLKTKAAADRAREINPSCEVVCCDTFVLPDNIDRIPFDQVDYVIDCIDTVSTKIALVCEAQKQNVPVISCMGTGNKLDPLAFEINDIFKTSVCPLARVIRRELKSRGIKHLNVLYSKEMPISPVIKYEDGEKHYPGSVPFVPSAAGIIIGAKVVKDLCTE